MGLDLSVCLSVCLLQRQRARGGLECLNNDAVLSDERKRRSVGRYLYLSFPHSLLFGSVRLLYYILNEHEIVT